MIFHIVLQIQIDPRLDFGGNFFHMNIYAKNTIILFIWKGSGDFQLGKSIQKVINMHPLPLLFKKNYYL